VANMTLYVDDDDEEEENDEEEVPDDIDEVLRQLWVHIYNICSVEFELKILLWEVSSYLTYWNLFSGFSDN